MGDKTPILTKTFQKFLNAWTSIDPNTGDRYRHLWSEGGTWASKTYSIKQLGVLILENWKGDPILWTTSSESLPHLKRGAMRDFLTIMGDNIDYSRWNKTDFVYTWPNKCQMEFVSADHPSKFKGGRRDILYVNEANHISRDSFRQADMRTRLFTIADWNPESEFWFHEEGLIDEPGAYYVHSTYQDALEVLPDSVKREIESYETKDPNWWNVYGLGLVGRLEGLVYPYFNTCDVMPESLDWFYGLDFGFSNDPTVLTKHIIIGDDLYCEELIYDTGLTNQDIADRLAELGIRKRYDEIVADSAEPKSIEELCRLGYNIIPSIKGPGSVEYGHQKVRQYKIHWTKDSINCIKEQRNFRYVTDKDGRLTDKTNHIWSHGMDAMRYAVVYRDGYGESVELLSIGKRSTWR